MQNSYTKVAKEKEVSFMNNKTEVVFILDRSGSMRGLEADTIGGFNGVLEKQKKLEGEVLVSTVLFNSKCKVLHDREPLHSIEEMTDDDYYVRGTTALLDAVGGAIHHIGTIHKYAREEDRPSKTMFVIITDGMENASEHYTSEKVKAMIERQQERFGWEFIFLGANMDAVKEAGKYGIRRSRVADYVADKRGTELSYDAVDKCISSVRCSLAIDDMCLDTVREDTKERLWKKRK
jgi:uncharacterized protein YegL